MIRRLIGSSFVSAVAGRSPASAPSPGGPMVVMTRESHGMHDGWLARVQKNTLEGTADPGSAPETAAAPGVVRRARNVA
jgi:hypothetical protein